MRFAVSPIALLLTVVKQLHVPVLSAAAPNSDPHHCKGTSCREASHEANASLRGLGVGSVQVGIVHLEGGEVAAREAGRQIAVVIHNQAASSLVHVAARGWIRAERIVLAALLL